MHSDLRKIYWFSLPGTAAALVLLATLGRMWKFSPLAASLGGVGAGFLLWFYLPMLLLLGLLRPAGRPLPRPLMMLWLFCFDFLGIPRQRMIELNNRLNARVRVAAESCLVMVARCLQWSDCSKNIIDNPDSCSDCGVCDITRIREVCRHRGVPLTVEAGGSSARHQLAIHRPKVVVAVACQREVLAGITDSPVPVIAIILESGTSPCRNSRVSGDKLDQCLALLTEEGC